MAFAFCGIGYFANGINQIFDLEIDRINKPNLPLVDNRLSMQTAKISLTFLFPIVLLAVLSSFNGWALCFASICFFLAVAYSVPPFRWKKNPWTALLCMLGARGIMCPAAVFVQFNSIEPLEHAGLIYAYIFVLSLFLTFAIATVKDIPDIKGDALNGVDTIPIRIGPNHTVILGWLSIMIIVLFGLWSFWMLPGQVRLWAGLSFYVVVTLFISYQSQRAIKTQNFKEFYRHIWKIYFTQYMMLPLILVP